MISENTIRQYLSEGKNLTTLSGKIPNSKNWTEKHLPEHSLFSYEGNLGWVLGESDFVIDVDPKNGGVESFAKLQSILNIELEPTVSTPSGGFHIYLELPQEYQGKQFHKTLKKLYPGIDFLTKGSQCVIPESTTEKGEYEWADDLFGEFVQSPTPKAVLELITYDAKSTDTVNDEIGDFAGLLGGSSSHWSENDVIDILARLDPSMPNGEWVKVGMALHDWDPVNGQIHWEEWSQKGSNYVEGETDKRWRSFDLGGGVTLGTIKYMASEVIYDETYELVAQYIDKVHASDEKTLEFELMPKISKENISRLNREKIVKAIQDRYKELTGVRMPIGSLRHSISNVDLSSSGFSGGEPKPAWCNNWVYVNTHAGFMNAATYSLHKSESFNIENGKYVPMGEGGAKPSAAKYVSDRGFVEKVDAIAYLPTFDGFICDIDGARVVNSFNPASVPKAALEYSKDGLAAIDLIKTHIKFICTTDENAHLFTQWLAHQVQYPGKQILWSPVVQAIQGVGKSFFGELLRACLGDRNVGTVSPTQVTSDFNGWATNVVVNVLEELRVRGHNRFEAVNALKPLITDRMIQINDKGVKQYMTYNTTNYMCFTNYKDSLPLDIDDRRWWVLFVQIESLADLKEHVGEDAITYFPKLFDGVRTNGSEIKKWLADFPITQEFLNIKQAPMTDEKLSMIATEDDSFEGLHVLRDLINEGGPYWNKYCLCPNDLFNQLAFDNPDLDMPSAKKNIILKKLGFSLRAGSLRIDGKSRRVWTTKSLDNDQIRQMFLDNDPGDTKNVVDYFDD